MSNLIIGFTRHLNFGTILIPYLCEIDSEDSMLAEEQATEASLKDNSLTDVEKEIIRLSLTYSEKSLMQAYSKEKKVPDFLRKLKEETFKKTIRPFIEKKQLEIIKLIRENDLPMYFKEAGKKKLYIHNRIKTIQKNAEVLFEFEANEETFSYAITCKCEGEPIALQEKKPIHVLTSHPACILAKDELLVFNDIESSRLLPFFKKRLVEVPAAMTKKYMEQIVLHAIERFEVNAVGFDVIEQPMEKRAELSIETSVLDKPILKLQFWYNDRCFTSEAGNEKKEVKMTEVDEKFSFTYFKRDAQWERECIAQLEQWGLCLISDLQFFIAEDAKHKTLIEWVEAYKDELKKKFS
ncbi:MAG: hypothetical protein EOM31_10920 [Bacteroidia bacterium]|nr:hypothetical protein [Bacteroidia bacterium]